MREIKMKVNEWLAFFKEHQGKKLFSLSDISGLVDEGKASLSVQLTRLVRSGLVVHPVRGWYENPFQPPTKEETAMVIRYPSYLSMEYALSYRGVLSQNVFTFTLVTRKLPYTFRSENCVYEYHQIRKELFWGYRWEGTYLVAESEKALLDLIYLRAVHSKEMDVDSLGSLVEDMEMDELDFIKLYKYAESYDRRTRDILSALEIERVELAVR